MVIRVAVFPDRSMMNRVIRELFMKSRRVIVQSLLHRMGFGLFGLHLSGICTNWPIIGFVDAAVIAWARRLHKPCVVGYSLARNYQ